MSTRRKNPGLPVAEWPKEDQQLWNRYMVEADPFDFGSPGPLSPATVTGRRYSFGVLLAFIRRVHPALMAEPLHTRLTKPVMEDFVAALRQTCRETTVALHLERVFFVVRCLCPDQDFRWIYQVARRIAVGAPRLVHPLVLSPQLNRVGLEGLSSALDQDAGKRRLRRAAAYRDGLIVAVLSQAPMRRGSIAGLRLADLTKVGDVWQIYARAEHVKTREAAEYELSRDLSQAVDYYLAHIRPMFPGADKHDGLWPSQSNFPLRATSIGRIVGDRTASVLGTRVSPHGFRRGAAGLIAVADPDNIRSARDLLGHHDFRITERHYLPAAQTRRAGRALLRALSGAEAR
ncbi:MAG: site-specific integrase [Rhizobiaceae bacterium]